MSILQVAKIDRTAFVHRTMAKPGPYVVPARRPAARPAAGINGGTCIESVQEILDTALVAEHLSTTLYYTALTSPRVMRNRQLAGGAGDPNNPGLPPGGHPQHVRFLQAALDAEAKHASLLIDAGARPRYRSFYLPATIFREMGSAIDRTTFLGVAEFIESLCIGMYVAAVDGFLAYARLDLAALATDIMGVEAEHRVLGRVLAQILPPNNLTLENSSIGCLAEVQQIMRPFLTGHRFLFAPDTTRTTAIPSQAQIMRIVGRYGTHRLSHF